MPTPVKIIVSVRITIAICLMIPFVIHVLEDVRTWLTDFGSHTVEFFIFGAIPHLFFMMFGRLSSIVFGASGDMRVTTKCQVTPLPTAFTLGNSQIYICTSNSSNILSYIKTTIDDILY